MRRARAEQDPLHTPLNQILGTEANVRILRELCLAEVPLSRTELAKRADLSRPGVFHALEKLRPTGIVSFVGAGSRQAVEVRTQHPLHAWLRTLFQAESTRVRALLDELGETIERTAPHVRAAWIEAVASEKGDRLNQPLVLGILVPVREAGKLAGLLRSGITRLELSYDVTIEPKIHTQADLLTLAPEEAQRLEQATPLFGPHPMTFLDATKEAARESPRISISHGERDRQALLVAAWVAKRLDQDPTLPKRARNWLVHRTHQASPREENELDEWLHLLDTASIPRLQFVLLDQGERSTRLRQSNPFVPVLSEAERESLKADTEP